jgi:acyl-CoA reductase-like NAD-dependent aldehyde dehydrogenase
MRVSMNFIDGRPVGGGANIEVRNPADREIVGRAAVASVEQADGAAEAAAGAAPGWGANPERRRLMLLAADAIDGSQAELAALLTQEQGKPLAEARGEIGRASLWLRHYAAIEPRDEIVLDDAGRRIEIVRRPVGPVLAITPWNFPISLMAWKLAPALAMGNPVIVKPSPFTPLTTQALIGLVGPLFPAGVLAVLAGGADLGRQLIEHPLIAKVAFTGSTATGRAIMSVAGPALKRVTLELGGNDAAIVLDDADPEAIADRLYRSAFANCGQVCIAVKRVLVARPLAARVTCALAERARRARVGPGDEPGVEMGPLNNEPQFERVRALVEGARRAGATIVAGGEPIGNAGFFHQPTIVTDIDPSNPLVEEEQFGPVLPILPFDDVDEAVALAERGPYGLGASIWTGDAERARALAPRLNVGTLWVNHHMEARPDAPFGGRKASGIGYENGARVLDEYSNIQVINEWRK